MKNKDIEELNFTGWPLSDEYLVELGRVSSLWAASENLLAMCIGKLAGFDSISDPKPFILVNHSSFPQKLDMLSALCEHLKKEFPNLKEYPDVISKFKTAQKARNIYLHNTIGPNPDTGKMEIAKGTARGKVKVSSEPICIADIRRATMQIDEAQTALVKLIYQRAIGPAWTRINA